MEYLILTETEFFGLINGNDETVSLNAAYNLFVRSVVELMHDSDTDGVKIALAYAENELQHHRTQYVAGMKSHTHLFVCKALSFIRKMQKHVPSNRPCRHYPLPSTPNAKRKKMKGTEIPLPCDGRAVWLNWWN